MIRLIHHYEGERTERSFRSIDTARRYMLAKLGPAPQAWDAFGLVMSENGGAIVPLGCSVRELLPRRRKRAARQNR